MISYQTDFFSPCVPLSSEQFARLTISTSVVNAIKRVRVLRQELQQAQTLYEANPDENEPLNQELLQTIKAKQLEYDRTKRTLPKIVWQATFQETVSRSGKGTRGTWRKQSAAILNGLFMLDIDHIEDVEQTIRQIAPSGSPEGGEKGAPDIAALCRKLNILLMHVTPSGHGLRLVAEADIECGNLTDNQARLASLLGVEIDQSCKDASRLSFCPGFEDILYIDKDKLFTYDNRDYDEKYGPQYRGNSNVSPSSAPTRGLAPALRAAQPAGQPADGGNGKDKEADGEDARLDAAIEGGYHGVSYEKIIDEWFLLVGKGEPKVGDRHRLLLRLAADLRYICDNNPRMVERAVKKHHVGSQYALDAGGADDIARIATDACARKLWTGIPKRFQPVLEAAGVLLDAEADGSEPAEKTQLDYDAYAQRLLPLLGDSPGLREAVAPLPDRLKLGGVLAAGAMLGTYLTRTWWEHFDGKLYRLSFLNYIVGPAASGKSFLTEMDRLLMAPLQTADRVGREAERAYKEKAKSRKANEQLPEQPHPVIRYCPSTTSNAILYRRLQDAVDKNVTDPTTDEPLHLHLITVESELATALRAQVGSWAGKSDLELKSFHNEKAGVDYANAESTNGIMQINWNQVISGTQESFSRKITPKNVLDGLVTRIALWIMPENDYAMLERKRYLRDNDRDCLLRSLGYKLEEVSGELVVPRLVDFCYQYEEQLTRQARIEEDQCLDYFRKRIPVLMMRYTLVRLVLRQLGAARKGEDLVVDDSDLEFARLIGDWCLEAQMHMFGQMVMDALERERDAFQPRAFRTNTRDAFNKLPEVIEPDDLVANRITKNVKSGYVTLQRWMKDGLVEWTANNRYKKKISKI